MRTDLDSTALDVLKAVADQVRWQIIDLLGQEELCVCHLVEVLGAPQPLISHHLKVLRQAGLVESERHRYWTYYRLVPAALAALGAEMVARAESAPAPGDRRRPCC